MAGWTQSGGVYSYTTRQRRCKSDWAGIGIGDAFKPHLDYYRRLPAQRVFYQAVRQAQMAVARHAGQQVDDGFAPRVQAQISPFYTNYPCGLAAHAAIGLTAFLELKARLDGALLASYMADFLEEPLPGGAHADPDLRRTVARLVVDVVQERLLLHDLNTGGGLPAIEVYRLFVCSQQSLATASLEDILRAAVHFGDVLPPLDSLPLHPTTRAILRGLDLVCRPYLVLFAGRPSDNLLNLGQEWVRDLYSVLAKYMPPARSAEHSQPAAPRTNAGQAMAQAGSLAQPQPVAPETETMAPLDEPAPPVLGGLENPGQLAMSAMLANQRKQAGQDRSGEGEEVDPNAQEILSEFAETMQSAGGQQRNWEDMRSDLVEEAVNRTAFASGPLEGSPAAGNEVVLSLGGQLNTAGEVYDRPVELSPDEDGLALLLDEARPITDLLRRNLYPNLEHFPESLRLRTSGALDSARLPLAGFSATVFRRFRSIEKADRRGKPLMVIACDGSGSLDRAQMRLLKVLAAAWLNSTKGSEVQVLAALYHSGRIRPGLSGPLVQWIYHPQKTPALSRGEAARALVALPDSGTGVQSDALSLAFIMAEARRLARASMIYLTLLSDTKWNRSFQGGLSGKEEVALLFRDLQEEMGPKLHSLLVALGDADRDDFEGIFDKEIAVSSAELADYPRVAERVGVYVAKRMREQRRKLNHR